MLISHNRQAICTFITWTLTCRTHSFWFSNFLLWFFSSLLFSMGNLPLYKKIIRKISHEWLCGFGTSVWKVLWNSTQLFLLRQNCWPVIQSQIKFWECWFEGNKLLTEITSTKKTNFLLVVFLSSSEFGGRFDLANSVFAVSLFAV